MAKITYFGHSAVQLDDGKHTLLIDPFLTGNPVCPVKSRDIEKVDYILVTHGHGDHLGDTIALGLKHKCTVIATWELAKYLEEKGVTVHPMSCGGSHEFPFGRVKMTLAFHGCGGDPQADGTRPPPNTPVGYQIWFAKKVFYHAGDTALFSDMKLISERAKVDVAFLPIGDNFTMGIEDAAHANELLNADFVMPIHYNTFDIIKVDPKMFAFKIEKQGKRCIILKPGEFFTLNK